MSFFVRAVVELKCGPSLARKETHKNDVLPLPCSTRVFGDGIVARRKSVARTVARSCGEQLYHHDEKYNPQQSVEAMGLPVIVHVVVNKEQKIVSDVEEPRKRMRSQGK